ncbi:MAG: 16S rRNA (adenine(1518)-N(6)/adenine(1519)-N(6))-dimethyltransferase RsmA [Kiritimatiellia bacterium]|jgi:16S rRNA (adenine1518-N6/adenine1519-N6)-dimethyltransferase|nr:16S rRNA (adenine(1518)-N(6)/adenine(1519)-N(6))-dimethyltransferase RsmA [Kiritimatiellia bacterium]MDP6630026.1 16S rRNA (adenine(1518)-N(6)/adenine(1519)-N(6))-dimethyltransferase RsmA [Kiritimatiellia bacterium]MDP6810969.1 16S rRNA (adenine(1518)-N(6)/adenine(1519)-N(6))-dimethyltransferase RsmA [Kiritimatiellia bacterium]MDP7025232.1 16S rRNA (adenine(1518)-N(6)/adenine(1519)-N(6))-dimethyltransferase RsmA [Kiritimatiellia bacterium]
MNLTSPTQVRALLDELDVRPSKGLGQNFLIDANVLRILIDAAGLTSEDRVLEVGPGLGVLTEALAGQVAELVAVEKDRRLAARLVQRFAEDETVSIVNGDMLKQRIDCLGSGRLRKVVANLPYRPGTRILVDLVRNLMPPDLMVLTIQREVAERLTAEVGGKDYGLLSVWVRRLYDVELVKVVSPTCFWPAPAVTSAIVRLVRHDRRLLSDETARVFYALTKHVFSMRRKQVVTALRKVDGDLHMGESACQAWLKGRDLPETARPQVLDVADWCALAAQIVP